MPEKVTCTCQPEIFGGESHHRDDCAITLAEMAENEKAFDQLSEEFLDFLEDDSAAEYRDHGPGGDSIPAF